MCDPVPLYRFLLSLLERVVMVLISQALCYLSHPDLDDGDKVLLKQELASELPIRDWTAFLPEGWPLPPDVYTLPSQGAESG